MVAAHAFDVIGARACGFRGAYVNRYRLPYEDSVLQPDTRSMIFESWLPGCWVTRLLERPDTGLKQGPRRTQRREYPRPVECVLSPLRFSRFSG